MTDQQIRILIIAIAAGSTAFFVFSLRWWRRTEKALLRDPKAFTKQQILLRRTLLTISTLLFVVVASFGVSIASLAIIGLIFGGK